MLAYLDTHNDLRMIEVDLNARHCLEHGGSDLSGKLRRGHREGLVGASRVRLEGLHTGEELWDVFLCRGEYRVDILLADAGTTYRDYTEDLLRALERGVEVAGVVERLDVYGRLRLVYIEIPGALYSRFQLSEQHILEIRAVRALEYELSVFQEKYFFHYLVQPFSVFYLPSASRLYAA